MDYKRLLTQVERTLEQIEAAESTRFTIEQIGQTIATNFRDELGITGGRVYELNDENSYELVGRFGVAHDGPLGISVPRDYKPIELVLENGVVVMDPNDPGVDPILESKLLIAFFVLGESKPPDLRPRTGIPPQFDKRVWHEVTTHGLLFAVIATLFITLLAVSGMETSVTLHARDRFHFTQRDLAWFFLFMGLIVASIQGGLIGRLAKKFGEKALVAFGAASFTIGLALVPLVWRVPMLYVVAFFIAVGQGLSYPSLTSLVTKTSPPNEHGSMLGLASGIGSLARFLGPIWCGFLYDLAQARGAFYGSAVLTAIAFLIALRMRKQPLLAEAAG